MHISIQLRDSHEQLAMVLSERGRIPKNILGSNLTLNAQFVQMVLHQCQKCQSLIIVLNERRGLAKGCMWEFVDD